MAEQQDQYDEMLAVEPNGETADEIEETKTDEKVAHRRGKAGERAKHKAEKTSAEDQDVLAIAQAKDKLERHALPVSEEQRPQRDFFISRVLEFDKASQTGRIEMEHGLTQTKQQFFISDGEGQVAFMKAYAVPTASPPTEARASNPEPSLPPAFPLPKPASPAPELQRQTVELTVSQIGMFHIGEPDALALNLSPEEAFVIQVRFQLQGPDAPALTDQESSYETKVYATNATGGSRKLLATQRGKLVKDILSYTAQMQVPGMSPGLYRLFTLVTLGSPGNLASYRDGPIVEVNQEQEEMNKVAASQLSLAR